MTMEILGIEEKTVEDLKEAVFEIFLRNVAANTNSDGVGSFIKETGRTGVLYGLDGFSDYELEELLQEASPEIREKYRPFRF